MAYRRTEREQARLDGVRDRIIDAAVALVSDGGWAAVSIVAVAAEAGVATGTVYRHVADKDELCAEAFRRAAGRELEVVRRAMGGPDAHAPALVESGLRAFASRALAAPRLARALLTEPTGETIEQERARHRAGHRQAFARVLRAGVAEGSLEPHDANIVAAVLVGAMGEALLGPLAVVDDGDTDAQVDALVHACLRALPRAAAA